MEATATKEKNTTIDDFEKNVLEPHQKEINKSIDDFFEEQKVEFSGSPESHESFEKIREFSLSPGKRVRSLLAIEGYKACGGNDIYAIKRLSVSFEILHNYLLVHDDIMDKDKLRRGKPTVQHGYELDLIKKNLETELIEHTGNSLAIIDGDILAALAQLPILDSPFAYELKEKVQREQIKTILNTGFGQKLDVLSTITMPSMEQLLYTHKLKTADYTVVNPLISGAILAGASDEEITVLKEYGYNTGMAFQLKDDELGLSPESLNKDKNDISEGKNTLIIIRAFDQLDINDGNRLEQILKSRTKDKEQVKEALELINKTDALAYNKRLYEEFANKACSMINNSGFNYQTKEFFCNLTKYIVNRKK